MDKDSDGLDIVGFHPLAIDERGEPDYARRSPYPAILFIVRNDDHSVEKSEIA